jgi:hypothetical protein
VVSCVWWFFVKTFKLFRNLYQFGGQNINICGFFKYKMHKLCLFVTKNIQRLERSALGNGDERMWNMMTSFMDDPISCFSYDIRYLRRDRFLWNATVWKQYYHFSFQLPRYLLSKKFSNIVILNHKYFAKKMFFFNLLVKIIFI